MQLSAKRRWFQQCDITRIDLHEQFNVQLDGRTTYRVGGGTCRTNGLPYFLNHDGSPRTSTPLLILFFRLSDGWPGLMKERARKKTDRRRREYSFSICLFPLQLQLYSVYRPHKKIRIVIIDRIFCKTLFLLN